MTTHLVSHPLTVRAILFGPAEKDAAALTQSLSQVGVYDAVHRATANLSRIAQQEARSQLTNLANQAVGTEIVDIVGAGWRKHRELAAVAKATAAEPGKTVFVDLWSHRIRWTHDWTVDVIVSEITVAAIDFTLRATFDIEPLLAIVRAGRLDGLRGGRCVVETALDIQHQTAAEQRWQIDLNTQIGFRSGLALC